MAKTDNHRIPGDDVRDIMEVLAKVPEERRMWALSMARDALVDDFAHSPPTISETDSEPFMITKMTKTPLHLLWSDNFRVIPGGVAAGALGSRECRMDIMVWARAEKANQGTGWEPFCIEAGFRAESPEYGRMDCVHGHAAIYRGDGHGPTWPLPNRIARNWPDQDEVTGRSRIHDKLRQPVFEYAWRAMMNHLKMAGRI